MINIPEMMRKMIGNKEEVAKTILKLAEDSHRISQGMEKMALNEDKPDADRIATLTKYMAKIAHNQSVIGILLMVYVGGSQYDADAATVATKFGADPVDTLREMFKRKMGQ